MPNRKTLVFPSQTRRRELLQQLLEMQNANPALIADEAFQAYANSVKALDSRFAALSAEDENGIPKNLTEEEANELCTSLVQTAELGEQYLAAELAQKHSLTQGVPAVVDKLQGMMALDFNALRRYDPKKAPMSLPEIQEGTRTTVIDLRGKEFRTVGNQMNSRIPLSVVNAKGEKRPGVFTRATRSGVAKDFKAEMNKAKALCRTEEEREVLDSFISAVRMKYIDAPKVGPGKVGPDDSDELIIGYYFHNLGQNKAYRNRSMNVGDVRAEFKKLGLSASELPDEALNSVAETFTKHKNDIGTCMIPFYLEIPDDSRLDSRNSAFSSLAGLLNVQDMVAHAENMQFIEEDGTVTEGTFMEYADGLDLAKKPEHCKHLAADPLPMGSETRGQFLSSLADLAVADFLGMNMDRHAGNVIYQVDQEGHLTGVKAIDNDASFGPAVSHKASVRDLRVISKDMALKVSKLTPDMLKFSLRGHGLSEKEIECAGKRLTQLQDELTQKKIRVIDKEKFKDIDWNICLPRGNGTNIFSEVLPYVEKVVERNAENKVPFEPYQKPASPDLPEVSATNRRGTAASFTESLERISKKVVDKDANFNVDDLTRWGHGSSKKYKAMVEAAKKADALRKTLGKNIDITKLATDVEEHKNDPEFSRMVHEVVSAFDEIRRTTDTYLGYKTEQRHADSPDTIKPKNDYEAAHIEYAKSLKKLADEFFEGLDPQSVQGKDDRLSNETRRELERRRAEAKPAEGPMPG